MQPSIFIRHNNRNIRIVLSEIDYIEANRNYTLVCLGERKFSSLHTMLEWEAVLPASDFCRVHRGYIVALGKMTAFDQRFVYLDELKLPIGEVYHPLLEKSVIIMNPTELRISRERRRRVGVEGVLE